RARKFSADNLAFPLPPPNTGREKDRGRRKNMEPTLIAAALSLAGSLIGTFAGILASSKMTNYRLEQLETKVSKHNEVVERTYKLEGQVLELQHDVRDLKK